MLVDGTLVQGGQNIFFAQLASPGVAHFSADAARYFSGEFIFMIFGLPGAALAMYRQARPEHQKAAGGLLFSASLTSILTGITEPIEFSFLFVAPMLFAVQVVLAGSAYMVAHLLNIAVGLTFSGGLLDLFLFGILQGNQKTDWLRIIPAGVIYFLLYYVLFTVLIKKFNLKTPGREDPGEETRLYRRADVEEKNKTKARGNRDQERERLIVRGLGGRENISDVDCCATRLRITVYDPKKVQEKLLRETGASGVILHGQGVQVVYGPGVTVIKSDLEEYLGQEIEEVAAERVLYSPFCGQAAPITEADDPAFAQKMMGDGYLVEPSEGILLAPEDGEVIFVFPTKHALGFRAADGLEMMFHIGIDTVKLNGAGFEQFVKEGQPVKKGQQLVRFDLPYLREHAASAQCLVLCSSLAEGQEITWVKKGTLQAGDAAAKLKI